MAFNEGMVDCVVGGVMHMLHVVITSCHRLSYSLLAFQSLHIGLKTLEMRFAHSNYAPSLHQNRLHLHFYAKRSSDGRGHSFRIHPFRRVITETADERPEGLKPPMAMRFAQSLFDGRASNCLSLLSRAVNLLKPAIITDCMLSQK